MRTNTLIEVCGDNIRSVISMRLGIDCECPTSKIKEGKGSPFVCCGRSGASGLPRGFCGRREGCQAASGCLSLPGPGILMSKTSNSFLKGGGYPMYRC